MPHSAATEKPRLFALVPCAGNGSRAGTDQPKQYARLRGRSVVAHTLAALAQVERLAATLVVLAPGDAAHAIASGATVWLAQLGGRSRADTVANGLVELRQRGAADDDWVLVHDAARCLLRPAWVDRLIDACIDDPVGGLLALPLADTLKRADGDDPAAARVAATLPRQRIWAAQTPQMFRLGLLLRALGALLQPALAESGLDVTDEASAVEALGLAPKLVPGDAENFKLTWPGDFGLAERLLASRETEVPA